MDFKVLGLGTAAMDIVLQCEELPREDGFAFIHDEQLIPGGSCANVLVALTKLGVKTSLIAQMGDEYYGKALLADLAQAGVDIKNVFIKPKGSSLHTFITLARNGNKAIFANLGDSLLSLSAELMTEEMLKDVKVFYTDMFPGKPALKLAKMCKNKNIIIAFNLQCSPAFMELCQVTRNELDEMLSMADVIFSCREGLLEMTGEEDLLAAGKKVYAKYRPAQGLLFTVGEKGTLGFFENQILEVDAFMVQAIDTTGAGDAFTGGYIYARYGKGMGTKESITFANACAAKKCTQYGARLNVTEEEINQIIHGN